MELVYSFLNLACLFGIQTCTFSYFKGTTLCIIFSMNNQFEKVSKMQYQVNAWSMVFKLGIILLISLIVIQFFLIGSLLTARNDVENLEWKVQWNVEEYNESKKLESIGR